jgi:hypothetical protein
MTGYATAADETPLAKKAGGAAEFSGTGSLPTSAGSFTHRRARYLAETGKQLLSTEQLRALDTLIRVSDPEAKQKAIIDNLNLVAGIASRYADQGMNLFDLIREGNHGLIHALEKFEPEGGFRFSDFATMCISQHIECVIRSRDTLQDSFRAEPKRAGQPAASNHLPRADTATGDLDGHPA